jgi:Ran GTPase-activating protein (RanGAP) involved in mRNA processing and transport
MSLKKKKADEVLRQILECNTLDLDSLVIQDFNLYNALILGNLVIVNLSGCLLREEGALDLASGIEFNCRTLQVLNLNRNCIRDQGLIAILNVLNRRSASSNLHSIYLADNRIGESGAKALSEFICAANTLETLDLSLNPLNSIGMNLICGAMNVNRSIIKLLLASIFSSAESKSIEGVLGMIKSNDVLENLDLGGNFLDSNDLSKISKVLRLNKSLQKLFLYSNDIESKGARVLSSALIENTALKVLDIGINNIGDEGAKYIADLVKDNNSLEELYLYENNVSAQGAFAIAESLKMNSSIQKLFLYRNQINDTGAKYLAEALKSNSTICELSLRSTNLKCAHIDFLQTLIENHSLITLDLSHTYILPANISSINDFLKLNQRNLRTSCMFNLISLIYFKSKQYPNLYENSILKSILIPFFIH